eukprot:7172169-Pyramimonas_sp.AAC.1
MLKLLPRKAATTLRGKHVRRVKYIADDARAYTLVCNCCRVLPWVMAGCVVDTTTAPFVTVETREMYRAKNHPPPTRALPSLSFIHSCMHIFVHALTHSHKAVYGQLGPKASAAVRWRHTS